MENDPEVLTLPKPDLDQEFPLVRGLQLRRSIRNFQKDRKLTLDELSNLLWSAQGLVPKNDELPQDIQKRRPRPPRRTAPSGAAFYSLELYIVTREGLYSYLPEEHSLAILSETDMVDTLAETYRFPFLQDAVRSAAATVLIASDMEKATRWASNALDTIGAPYIEAGTAAQNLMLMATGMGLGTVLMTNFDAWHCAQYLQLPKRHSLILSVLVGQPQKDENSSDATRKRNVNQTGIVEKV